MEIYRCIKLYLWKYHPLITSLLLFLFHITTSTASAGVRYEYHEGDHKANWSAALNACVQNKGQLAGDIDIDDWELMYGKSSVFMDDKFFLIGLQRLPSKMWQWITGEPLDVNQTTAFPLRPEYQDNITWDCVTWGVKQPFFVPQDCDAVSPFICKLDESFPCNYTKKEKKKINDTNIATVTSEIMDAARAANTTNTLPEIFYLKLENHTEADCQTKCSTFDESTDRQCWLFEFYSGTEPWCRLVLSEWKPVLVNLLDEPSSVLYARYCIEVEKFTHCELGEECLCGNVTVPPNTEQLEEILEETKKKLTVPKHNLSSTVRKKTSAPDPRPASMTMGYFGVSMLTITFGGLVLLDISSLIADFKMMFYNLQCCTSGKESYA